MATFDLNTLNSALENSSEITSGVDFSGKSLKLDTANDAQPIVDAINTCSDLQYLTLTGNTLGVTAAEAISAALVHHPELKVARFSDMFTGRMKTEIPPALSALGDGMISAGARLAVLDLSDNAFGPIGVEGLAKLLQSDACSELEELYLNNNGLGITGGRLLATALSSRPRKLKIFVAGRNRLENDGAKALAGVFKSMGTLEEVSMPQNGIYHEGISALSDAFKKNPALSRLNLNDNTVGVKGASALADAMASLKNLKAINFGDCLIKSKGASALAKAFKDNQMQIESIDLGHNEIGKEACMEVVDGVTSGADSEITRLVLAGNNLGGAANKKIMREKLGAAAELSDGDDSDEDDEDDSASEHSDSDQQSETNSESEDSATEDARHSDTIVEVNDTSLDTSNVIEVETDVGRFLKEPTLQNLQRLGPQAACVIDTHLQAIKEPADFIQAYVEATLLVSGLERTTAKDLYALLTTSAQRRHAIQWLLAESFLRGLGLIKSENKSYKIRWSLPECYTVLATVIDAPHFPHMLRDTLRFFIKSKLTSLPEDVKDVIHRHTSLRP